MDRDKAIDAAALKYVSIAPVEERRAAFLASLRANGWVVVPVEATDKMVIAFSESPAWQQGAKATWDAMLAAAEGDSDGN